jgi:hypothetical protein
MKESRRQMTVLHRERKNLVRKISEKDRTIWGSNRHLSIHSSDGSTAQQQRSQASCQSKLFSTMTYDTPFMNLAARSTKISEGDTHW